MIHPQQPILRDKHFVERFKQNNIVSYLLDQGPFSLNDLAALDFNQEDWDQFAQLIGYSVSGYLELSYISDGAKDRVEKAEAEKSRDNRIEIIMEIITPDDLSTELLKVLRVA